MVSAVFGSCRTVSEAKSLWEDILLTPNGKNDLAILDRRKLNVFLHVFRFKMVTFPLVVLVSKRKIGFILCRMLFASCLSFCQRIVQYCVPSVSAKTTADIRFFTLFFLQHQVLKYWQKCLLTWDEAIPVFLSGDFDDKGAASLCLSVLVK